MKWTVVALTLWGAFGATSVQAQSEADQMVVEGWQRLLSLCGPAIADPDAYFAQLPPVGPHGEPTSVTSDDGSLIRSVVDRDGWTQRVTLTVLGEDRRASCNVYISDESAPPPMQLGTAFSAFATQIVGADGWSGGRISMVDVVTWNGSTDVYITEENFEFSLIGGLAGLGGEIFVQIREGYYSWSVT